MTDKIVAGIVTGVMVAPLCALCALGPAAVGSALTGVLGWLGRTGPTVTVVLSVAIGLLIYRSIRRRRQRDSGLASPQRSLETQPSPMMRTESPKPYQTRSGDGPAIHQKIANERSWDG